MCLRDTHKFFIQIHLLFTSIPSCRPISLSACIDKCLDIIFLKQLKSFLLKMQLLWPEGEAWPLFWPFPLAVTLWVVFGSGSSHVSPCCFLGQTPFVEAPLMSRYWQGEGVSDGRKGTWGLAPAMGWPLCCDLRISPEMQYLVQQPWRWPALQDHLPGPLGLQLCPLLHRHRGMFYALTWQTHLLALRLR